MKDPVSFSFDYDGFKDVSELNFTFYCEVYVIPVPQNITTTTTTTTTTTESTTSGKRKVRTTTTTTTTLPPPPVIPVYDLLTYIQNTSLPIVDTYCFDLAEQSISDFSCGTPIYGKVPKITYNFHFNFRKTKVNFSLMMMFFGMMFFVLLILSNVLLMFKKRRAIS